MAYEVVVPRLGLTMEEGRIVEWFKDSGQTIEAGEPLFAVETDKVVQEIEAPVSGTVHIIPDLPSDPMPIGTAIGFILAPGEEPPSHGGSTSITAAEPSISMVDGKAPALVAGSSELKSQTRQLSSPAARRRAKELGIDWQSVQRPGGGPILVAHVEAAAKERTQPYRIKASPVARRLAESEGIDLAELAAQKPGQEIRRADVEAAISSREKEEVPTLAPVASMPAIGEAVPVTQIRRIIAQRMLEGSQLTAPVTLTTEADATDLVAVREQFKAALGPRNMVVPTYTDLLIKLTSAALSEHPMLNAVWQEDQIVIPDGIHIAVAVDVPEGLVVPIIRDIPAKSLQQVAEESRALAQEARSRKLGVDDLQGGTFTITNLGTYGIDAFTPIINLPQCAILGVGRILEKPAMFEGEIAPRQMMALSLTFDHRVVDGGPAARFLNTIRQYVEQPYLWLSR
jgi:pyruvate dehydrogenase E2 component (dihydrolipoamide acetyltransferase)